MSTVAGVLAAIAVTPAIGVAGAATTHTIGIFEGLPEYLHVDQLAQPTTIYAKDGDTDVALATFYSQNRLPVTFDQISVAAKDAAIAGEDPRFYSHGGIDVQGTHAWRPLDGRRRPRAGRLLDHPAVREERAPAEMRGAAGQDRQAEGGVQGLRRRLHGPSHPTAR